MKKMPRASDVTHSRPEWRSFETPDAKKMTHITSHIIRMGHVYSPCGARGAPSLRLAARINESTENPSPQRENAKIAMAQTRIASAWLIFPNDSLSPIRYVPRTAASAVEARVA